MCWDRNWFLLKSVLLTFKLLIQIFVHKVVEESKQTVPFQDNRLMIDGVKIDISSIPFRELKIAFLFIPVLFSTS